MAGPAPWDPSAEPYVDYLVREYPNGSPRPDPAPADAGAAPASSGDSTNSVLGADPSYQAFKAALGLNENTAQQNTQSQIDAANQSLATRLPQIAHAGDLARQKISGSMESRGLLNSGETVQNLGNQRYAEGQQTAGLQDQTAQRVAALQQSLADRMQSYNLQDVNQQQAALQRQYLAQQQAAINAALAAGTPILPGGGLTPLASAGGPGSTTVDGLPVSQAESFIIGKESGGDVNAKNPSSGAFGIGQLNPSSGTLQSIAQETGIDPYTTNPAEQLAMMRQYISDRYGTAEAAAAHEQQYGWY